MPGGYMDRRDDRRNDRRDDPRGRDRQMGARPPQPRDDEGRSNAGWEGRLKALKIDNQVCDEALIRQIIQQRNGKLLVDTAEVLGTHFYKQPEKHRLTTSQIRNIFGIVKRMEMKPFVEGGVADELVMLRPKLKYAAARAKADGTHQFAEVLTWAIKAVDMSAENFKRFVDFFEAILAYHKAAGGK